MKAALILTAAIVFMPALLLAAPPLLEVPDGQLGLPGSRVAPNLLLHLSLTFADAGAAYRDQYSASVDYAGYFNPRMCYRYPAKGKAGGVPEPDLGDRSGYFSPLKAADSKRQCGADSFSGNLLNWASMSTLDLLRHALTGGDRIIDERGLTVLQRAWLPDGAFHPDFYAHPLHFPRKAVEDAASVTPFGGGTIYIVSCRNRVLFSHTATGASCDAPRVGGDGKLLESDKHLGEFNVRVKVCDAADSESRPQLCIKYKGGFKPEGAVQRNAGLMRIGAMGYLTESGAADPNLYGGVLRAPLKSARTEWDAVSGVLEANPDRSGASASGTINYINLLGRSAAGRHGAYKGADPGAELFYEGLRYLQGRAASPGSAGAPTDDAMAAWGARPDPLTESCQRSSAAMIGHSSFALDRYLPGNTETGRGDKARPTDGFSGSFDVMQATRTVGQFEAGAPDPRPDLANLDMLADGVDGEGSYYLAGAAYWAHTNPIRPDAETRVETLALELGAATRPRASALYLAAKYGAFHDRNSDRNPFVTTQGEPANSEWTADGSAPSGYFPGADPHAIAPSVHELFAAGRLPRGEVTGQAASGGSYLVRTSYDRQLSAGTLRRYGIVLAKDGAINAAETPVWDAAQSIPSHQARKIYTLVDDGDGGGTTVEFRWDSLPGQLRELFDRTGDGLGEARVDFIRGDRSRETGRPAGLFRRRASVLADAVHGAPLIIGAPSASVQGAGYRQFHATASKRASAVYLGANDGMLHAFDAASGAELFAYVPNALHPGLHQLSEPGYLHRAYVDASPGYGEALVNGKWRTVLASGMGMGARGVFALDVTDPSSFAEGLGALWEFTDDDDAAIGHIRSAPVIGKFQVGSKGAVPEFRYFVVVASGWNNYQAGGSANAARGALFLLALDKPATEPWKIGVNYYKLATPPAEITSASALAPPAFALAPNGSVRYAYAGDLQGNVWRFDFTGKPPWSKAVGPGPGQKPLFVARDADGNRQPVMHAPRVVFAPGGGYLVLFGTSKFIENADLDPAGYAAQSFYAIRDSGAETPVPVSGRSELAPRTLSGDGPYVIEGDALRYDGKGARKGWYIDFPNWRLDGERSAGTAFLASGALVFDTLAPGTGVCAAPVTRNYIVDALTGMAYTKAGEAVAGQVTGDVVEAAAALAPPLLFDMGMVAGRREPTGAAVASHKLAIVRLRAGGQPPLVLPVAVKAPVGRVSWREVANWQELHEAAKR